MAPNPDDCGCDGDDDGELAMTAMMLMMIYHYSVLPAVSQGVPKGKKATRSPGYHLALP